MTFYLRRLSTFYRATTPPVEGVGAVGHEAPWNHPEDEDKQYLWTVDITTLEDLMRLYEKAGDSLVISGPDEYWSSQPPRHPVIEIWDEDIS